MMQSLSLSTKPHKKTGRQHALLMLMLMMPCVHSLATPRRGGGGRAPGKPDMPSLDSTMSWLRPPAQPAECRLTIAQITDVYTLENFPHFKTLLNTIRAAQGPDAAVISMLTGDFLAPYLLSSIDRGAGMMNAIAKTPIDYLTFGNHEADIDHRTVCRHIENYPGIWLNSNMQDHDAMQYQAPYDIIEVTSPDGSNTRRIGLVAVLSDDPDLYSHFKAPGAFGGATATMKDPWETLRHYKAFLEDEKDCDIVIPLQHTYVPDDHRTCHEFDFPLVLSGHDHHRVDEVVHGTRLVKPGLDGIYAAVVEICWSDAAQASHQPKVRSTFVQVDQWEADPVLKKETDRAYDVLSPLRDTELARIPPTFTPLSSQNARGSVCTMGRLICSLLKSSLNTSRRQRTNQVDAVILMGGNIRGGQKYPDGSFFSLEALEAEIKSDEVVGVLLMPGRVLAKAIEETHAGPPIPGWMQYDDGIREEATADGTTVVTTVAGKPLDPDKFYRVATKISDLTNGQSPTLTEYCTNFPQVLPSRSSYFNIQAELMAFFARNLFRKLWEATGIRAREDDDNDDDEEDYCIPRSSPLAASVSEMELCDVQNCDPEGRLNTLDSDGDGIVTQQDIQRALRDFLGLSISEEEMILAEYVHSFADTTNTGKVTLQDFELFCKEMPEVYENQKWRLAFPKPVVPDQNDNGSADETKASTTTSTVV